MYPYIKMYKLNFFNYLILLWKSQKYKILLLLVFYKLLIIYYLIYEVNYIKYNNIVHIKL